MRIKFARWTATTLVDRINDTAPIPNGISKLNYDKKSSLSARSAPGFFRRGNATRTNETACAKHAEWSRANTSSNPDSNRHRKCDHTRADEIYGAPNWDTLSIPQR